LPGNIGLCVGWVNAHGAADADGSQGAVADFSRHGARRYAKGCGKLVYCEQGRHGYVMHLFWCLLRVGRQKHVALHRRIASADFRVLEQPGLCVGLFYSAAGYVKVFALFFNANEPSP